MKKNYRFLSSIALTGMLATSIMGTTVNAATPSVDVIGVCSNVLSNKIVPVVVKNGADCVTMADIKNSGKFDIVSVIDANAPLKTGSKFKVKDGTEYTVVVYGDANKDGSVDTFDALYIQENAFNEFKGEEKVAADVIRKDNSGVDTFDALRIREYAGGAETRITGEPHTPDSDPVVTDSNYTIKVNENGFINNQNDTATKVELKLAKTYDEAKTLKVKVIDENKNAKEVTVTIPAHTDTYVFTDAQAIDTTAATALANGEITIELYEGTKLVGITKATKHVETPVAAKVVASRPSATTAALSLEGYGEGKIVTVKYKIAGTTEKKEINNVNDKLANQKLDYVFPEGATTMDITLIDEYGNEAEINGVAIPAHGAKAEDSVEKVTAPDLTKTGVAKFTTDTAITGEAILYDANGNIVDKKEIAAADNVTFDLDKAGKYRVGVVVTGNGTTTTNSEEVFSDFVEVKELNAVSNVEFNVEKNGDKVIVFTDSNDTKNVDETTPYAISFEKLNGDNGYVADSTVTATIDAEKHTATITGLNAGTVYRATIVVKPKKNQGQWITNSNPTVSSPFFFIDASNLLGALDSRTDNSLTYELANPITVNGTEATYKAEVYKINEDQSGVEYMSDTMESKAAVVTETKAGKLLTIEGLEDNQKYVIRIIANVGDVQGESNLIGYNAGAYASAPKTYTTTPAIKGLKVVQTSDITDTTKAVAGTLFVDATNDKVIVNGDKENVITIGIANNNYTPEFNSILTLAKSLLNNDKITVNNESVKLELTDDESSSNVMTLTSDYKGLAINVIGQGIESDRKMEIASGAKLEKLTVEGNGLILALTNNDADTEVVIANGAEVKVTGTNKTYTLAKGATATIEGITVNTTNADISMTSTGDKALTVNAPKGDLNTDLTFTNNNNGRYDVADEATINFASNDQTSRIAGTVKINSTNGSVKVKSPNDNSLDVTKLNLEIDVTDADVDITGFKDSAKVNVSVATTEAKKTETVIKAIAKNIDMLDELDGLTVADNDEIILKQYAVNEEMKAKIGGTADTVITGKNRELMQEFINTFGVNDENVKLTIVDAAKGSVTITFPAETDMSKVNLSGFATYGE